MEHTGTKPPEKPAHSVPPRDRKKSEFRHNIQSWLTTLDPKLLRWARRTRREADDSLRRLYTDYGIPPSEILGLLARLRKISIRDENAPRAVTQKLLERVSISRELVEKTTELIKEMAESTAPENPILSYLGINIDPRELKQAERWIAYHKRSKPRETEWTERTHSPTS